MTFWPCKLCYRQPDVFHTDADYAAPACWTARCTRHRDTTPGYSSKSKATLCRYWNRHFGRKPLEKN